MESNVIKYDCRYFIGEKPCKYKRLCEGCPEYSPMGFKILIIKLGAMGDVLRTTPILEALKKNYSVCHITWLVDEKSYELLKNNPNIDKILIYNQDSILKLQIERFDLLINLEKIELAIALAELIKAGEKRGFGMSPSGTLRPLNPESLYALNLGIDDNLKFFKNKKSYQQIIFEAIKFQYKREEYCLHLSREDINYAEYLLTDCGMALNKKTVGICPGAGHIFANKAWLVTGYIELIDRLLENFNIQILLIGGEREKELNDNIRKKLKNKIADMGSNHSLSRFMAIIDRCDVLVSGDTLPMHIAIALKKKTLAIFGPTCHQEIDLYGRGDNIITKIECAPCYKSSCDITDNCMEAIPVDEVYQKAAKLIAASQKPGRD